MVILYFFFGYQKWFPYEAQELIPFFTHGPLIFWMYPVFDIRGSTYFLGVSEWLFGALLLAGFSNKKMGALGAFGSVVTFHHDGHDHPLHARWLGPVCWRVSRDGRERRLCYERRSTAGRFVLSAEAGSCQSHACS